MTTASIVIGVLLLLVMVCIWVYWAVTLPSDARIPLHYGIGSYGAISLARGPTTVRSG